MPSDTKTAFSGSTVDSYNEGPPRQVPGYSSLHRMVSMLLEERTPADGRILVLGAGGGQEIKALAEAHSGWTFDGVDPSADMLRLAKRVVGPFEERVRFDQYINYRLQGGRCKPTMSV